MYSTIVKYLTHVLFHYILISVIRFKHLLETSLGVFDKFMIDYQSLILRSISDNQVCAEDGVFKLSLFYSGKERSITPSVYSQTQAVPVVPIEHTFAVPLNTQYSAFSL